MRMLSERIRSCIAQGYASVPNTYAHHVLKRLRTVYALVPDVYAQGTYQFLMRMHTEAAKILNNRYWH
jgi:hypothetical protein